MDVRKTNGTIEEFDLEKLKKGIRQTYKSTGQRCPEEVVVSITDNLYIYNNMTSQEIRRQVVDSLMSINKKAALEYIQKFDDGMQKLLQPYIILTPDLNGYVRFAGSSSSTSCVLVRISITRLFSLYIR